MYLVFVAVGALVLFAVVAVVAGRAEVLGDESATLPEPGLPPGDLRASDLDRVTFTVALRGYRMDQVDSVLRRVRDELADRERRIAELESAQAPHTPGPSSGWPGSPRA